MLFEFSVIATPTTLFPSSVRANVLPIPLNCGEISSNITLSS